MTLSQQAPLLVERLNELSAWLSEHNIDMQMPVGMIDPAEAAARITELEGDLKAAFREISKLAREAGEAKGRLAMSEAAGIVDGWRERAERAEARCRALENAFPAEPSGWPEADHEFEVWQDGGAVASASSTNRHAALAEIQHYAAVYCQDGPVQIVEVIRRPTSEGGGV